MAMVVLHAWAWVPICALHGPLCRSIRKIKAIAPQRYLEGDACRLLNQELAMRLPTNAKVGPGTR